MLKNLGGAGGFDVRSAERQPGQRCERQRESPAFCLAGSRANRQCRSTLTFLPCGYPAQHGETKQPDLALATIVVNLLTEEMMTIIETEIKNDYRKICSSGRGKRAKRWPERIDQEYLGRIVDEGRLTRRDQTAMHWLVDVRCATTEQISRMFFLASGTGRNRLTQLYKMRILERAYLPPEDAEQLKLPQQTLVYYLGRGGKFWLQQLEKRQFEGGWKVQQPTTVAHDLMSTELVVALQEELEQLARSQNAKLRTRLESEVVFWRLDATGQPVLKDVKRRDGTTGKERVALLRSDMRLEVKNGEGDDAPTLISAFVEADRGTMTSGQFTEKVTAYNQAAEQFRARELRREARGEGKAQEFPQVWVVTTGATRARNLAQVISQTVAEGIMWAVIDWESLRRVKRLLLEPVWWKAKKGRVGAELPILPGLAKQLGIVGGEGDAAAGQS
jgi:hypothetical protein